MRVLFVDDEPQVLSGITRMLDAADLDWEIETAENGADALAVMAVQPVDVLVTDMRMPGMDGAALLEEVSKRYPHVVRIVLSGQAAKGDVFRAVGPMHQYLAKPCEARVLRRTIERSCALRALLDSTRSHHLLGGISSLPSLPALYQEVVSEIESPDGTVARVGEIVGQDIGMTAKILQLSNSAMFGLHSEVTTPAHAASLLGLETIRSLVLSIGVFKSCGDESLPGFSIEDLLEHCLRVATIARAICKSEGLGNEETSESFTAGLLHDVGKLILAENAPEDFAAAMTRSKSEGLSQVEVERELFGLAHDGIGGYLLALWGIPQGIVEAVAFHHQPQHLQGGQFGAAHVTYLANVLANEESGGRGGNELPRCEVLLESVRKIDRLDVWREAIVTTDRN